ncbi:FadR/GntR family transcriptional regulator [Hyphomicrobium sp. 2TAF46]|uniref:FadR/GntR family transcriptional regulator n=1 Tax=Hyphomicrobium sp. 2TAF46 TaxID=3233019 RepID=UPI003F91EF44
MLWGIRPVEQKSVYGLAVDGIRKQIHLGLVRPGERLPPERELADTLGVSRVTLREALRILESEGYLGVKRGAAGGAFVVDEAELRSLALRRIARDPAMVMRIIEFLAVNERVAARFAAQRRTPSHLKRMRSARAEMARAETPSALRHAETLFQMAVSEATQNSFLVQAIEDATAAAFMPLVQTQIESARTASAQLRSSLLDAIDDRADVEAEAAIEKIIEHDWARLRALAKLR